MHIFFGNLLSNFQLLGIFSVIDFSFNSIMVNEHILYGFNSLKIFKVYFYDPEYLLSW